MASFDLTWAHVGIAGLALDVAGAVVLGWAFSTKKPEEIRTEVPETLSTVLYPGSVTLAFPQRLAESMIRQRAEARLGLVLLVTGFLLQLLNSYLDLGALGGSSERASETPAR